jgi:hypothetical protein
MIRCSFTVRRFFDPYTQFTYSFIVGTPDSGHGGQVRDKDGDEKDGFDESVLRVI